MIDAAGFGELDDSSEFGDFATAGEYPLGGEAADAVNAAEATDSAETADELAAREGTAHHAADFVDHEAERMYGRREFGAATPDVVGPESAIGAAATYDSSVDAAFGGDDGVTPGGLEDFGDDEIADAVGPGALAQPLGRTAAREAARHYGATAGLGAVGLGSDVSDPQARALAQDVANLGRAEAGLARDDSALDLDDTEYWGDLRTGRVWSGEEGGVYSRIGPFKSAAEARLALQDAYQSAGGYHEPDYRV